VLLDERGERAMVVRHGELLEARETRGRTVVDRLQAGLTRVDLAIALDKKPAGQLSVVFAHKPQIDLDPALRFLRVTASMIAQSLRAHRLAEGERGRLLEENRTLRRELVERYELQNVVGNSGPMRQVFDQIAQVANGTTTVLVRGESGTGKELIAHAIHYNSPRAQGPFVRVSCAALPETLVESELFGHEKGAFTGAHAQKKGRFELADGGTLFLDEVGELSIATQVKLLRVLQEREFERLGGTQTLRANVRLIAATNRDIEKAIASGAFREDLYYRLDVFTVFVPPLRDRKPDIMPLADHFLSKLAPKLGRKKIKRISTAAIDMLTAYHWPGNVRELENAIERAMVVCDGSVLHAHHLPPTLQTAEASGTTEARTLADATAAFERDLIADTLKSTRGNRAKAARILGTTERILGYKATKYRIDARRFRA
jgi:Nif-specific regulatory protein